MLQWFTDNIISIISILFGGGGLIWAIIERKQRAANTKKYQADALQGMQTAYNQFVNDMQTRYDQATTTIEDLKKECNLLREKHEILKKESVNLERNLSEVKIQFLEEKQKYDLLKRDYEDLQKSHNILKKDYEKLKKEVIKKV